MIQLNFLNAVVEDNGNGLVRIVLKRFGTLYNMRLICMRRERKVHLTKILAEELRTGLTALNIYVRGELL